MARPLDLDNKASFSDKLLDDWNNACDFVRQNFFFIISGILLVSTIYTTISFLKDYLNLSTMAANANMTLFSLKCLLTIAALFIVALIVIICKKLYEQSLIPSIKHQMSISPYTANPVKHLGKGVKGFLQWFGKESRKRTIIYAMMGFAYVFPATMLFLTYYGHVIFSGPLAAINKVFLWISAGLVEPGKAQWVAALATGFLLAKIVLLVGDLIDSCAKGKFKDSYIAKFFIWFFSTPITNLVKISCLLFLVYIFSGISFFTHLSGSWLVFNLATILIKVVFFIYDLAENTDSSLLAKIILFVPRCLYHLLEFISQLMQTIFSFIFGAVEFVIRTLLWPIVRVFIALPFAFYNLCKGESSMILVSCKEDVVKYGKDGHSFRFKELLKLGDIEKFLTCSAINKADLTNILNGQDVYLTVAKAKQLRQSLLLEYDNTSQHEQNLQHKLAWSISTDQLEMAERPFTTFRKKTKRLAPQMNLFNWIFLALNIYIAIPIISILLYNHIIAGKAFNWFIQLAIDIQVKLKPLISNIDLPCIMAIFAIILATTLFMLNSNKRKARWHILMTTIALTSTVALICNAGKNIVTKIILIFVLAMTLFSILYHVFYQSKWLALSCNKLGSNKLNKGDTTSTKELELVNIVHPPRHENKK